MPYREEWRRRTDAWCAAVRAGARQAQLPVVKGRYRAVRGAAACRIIGWVTRESWSKLTRSADTVLMRMAGSHSGNRRRPLPLRASRVLLLRGAPVVHGCVMRFRP
ncbi:hypothetical protein GCM10017778_10480 [Streptomyces vinaceus]|nr:hypothetical protein GCM10017778_10480 [Streptomyces vinaceus]